MKTMKNYLKNLLWKLLGINYEKELSLIIKSREAIKKDLSRVKRANMELNKQLKWDMNLILESRDILYRQEEREKLIQELHTIVLYFANRYPENFEPDYMTFFNKHKDALERAYKLKP